MVCSTNKIDSNLTALYFAEEECFKQLPANGVVWYGIAPNEYSDTGGENTTVKRSPINPSRQDKKGGVVDESASVGFGLDFTKSNITRLLQGFFFADIREKATTKPMNGAAIALTGVDNLTSSYSAASGLGAFNLPGALVFASGFGVPANNGLKTVDAATATEVLTVESLTAEASPPAAAKLELVGFQFDDGDLSATFSSNVYKLNTVLQDLTELDLLPGSWIFIGGDATVNNFGAGKSGYARVVSVSANEMVLDELTFAPTAESGTGKQIRIFYGSVLRNESDPTLIKARYYQFERQLGIGIATTQAEYIKGATANELVLNVPNSEKLTASLTFPAATTEYVKGEPGDELKAGARIADPGEDLINTSENVFAQRLTIQEDDLTSSAMFGFIETGSLTISNGATPLKAVGTKGAFDMSYGNFMVSGEITGYFTSVAAIEAIRRNADIGYNLIISKDNFGSVFDVPLITAGGGRLTVTKDEPIKLPVTMEGAESKFGHTALYEFFPYLPDIAIAN